MSYLVREQEKIDHDFALVREALDLGMQAWRATDVRDKFHEAADALNRLAGRIGAEAPFGWQERS